MRKNRIAVVSNNVTISTHALTPRGLRAALRQRYMLAYRTYPIRAHFELNGAWVDIELSTLIIIDKDGEQVL